MTRGTVPLMQIEVTHEVIAGHDVLTPHGEVDLASFMVLRDAMAEIFSQGRFAVVLDLSATTFLDSTALGCLIGGRRQAEAGGGSFTVLVDKAPLLKLLAITGLDQIFTILPDREAWLDVQNR